jgi:Pilus assembly protein, PilP
MTMKFAKAPANLLAVLTMLFCLAPSAWSQAAPAKKPARKAKASAKTAPAAKTAAGQAAAPAAAPAPEDAKLDVGKRDPFVPLIRGKEEGAGAHLPPGKAGLVVATVRIDGTVQMGNGMIAVVSNPEDRVYFIREGDRVYDGQVEKISLEGVTFREFAKDTFGKPVEREVTKRIYASAGEQQ